MEETEGSVSKRETLRHSATTKFQRQRRAAPVRSLIAVPSQVPAKKHDPRAMFLSGWAGSHQRDIRLDAARGREVQCCSALPSVEKNASLPGIVECTAAEKAVDTARFADWVRVSRRLSCFGVRMCAFPIVSSGRTWEDGISKIHK